MNPRDSQISKNSRTSCSLLISNSVARGRFRTRLIFSANDKIHKSSSRRRKQKFLQAPKITRIKKSERITMMLSLWLRDMATLRTLFFFDAGVYLKIVINKKKKERKKRRRHHRHDGRFVRCFFFLSTFAMEVLCFISTMIARASNKFVWFFFLTNVHR